MKVRDAVRVEGWMREEEALLAQEMVRALQRVLKKQGAPDTPLVALRVNDVVVSYLLVRRAEEGLRPPVLEEDVGADVAVTPASVIEGIGKTRERLRKAMKELEEYCAKVGAPTGKGLADRMAPLMKKGEGALEEMVRTAMEKSEEKKENGNSTES